MNDTECACCRTWREAITSLIEDLEQSARATAPSKKSAIEQTVAERLTVLLGGAGQPGTEGT